MLFRSIFRGVVHRPLIRGPLLLRDRFWYPVFALMFGVLLFFAESRRTQIIQVLTVMFVGLISASILTPVEIGGDLSVIVAAVLAYKYGLLQTRARTKLSLMFGALVFFRIVGTLAIDRFIPFRIANQIAVAVVSVPFLYWLFEEELIRTREQRDRITAELARTEPFVEFGRNVSGIIHDFKNDASLFSAFGSLLRMSQGTVIDDEIISSYDRYVARLHDRIQRVLVATHARDDANQEFDLIDAVRASMYAFESNLELRRSVRMNLEEPLHSIQVRGNMAQLIAILENVMRNSCDALIERAQNDPAAPPARLGVAVELRDGTVEITIEDNGPGLPFCQTECESNCLFCPEVQLGRTSKVNGTGIGLFRIRSAADRLGATVVMRSRRNVGVKTVIRLSESMVIGTVRSDDRSNSDTSEERIEA